MRPWSTVLRVPTREGDLYYKEPIRALAFEAPILDVMRRRRPELLPEVVAWDPVTGALLLRDAGVELGPDQPDGWAEALPLYGELQRDVARDAHELSRLIPLDRRLAALPERYAELLGDAGSTRVGLPGGLTRDEYAQARRLAVHVVRGCDALAAHAVPETIQNDDLTHGSIFSGPHGYRFLDWGDACVSHPFFSLTVTLRVVEHERRLPPGSAEVDRLRDAYLEPWTAFEPRATLVELAAVARRVGQACRAVFHRYLARAIPEGDLDSESAAWALRLFLAPEAWRGVT